MIDNDLDEQLQKILEITTFSEDGLARYLRAIKTFCTQDMIDSYSAMQRLLELRDEFPLVDIEKRIKQLKKQSRYSKNPMEIKRLNQEIMEMQKELNKSKHYKTKG